MHRFVLSVALFLTIVTLISRAEAQTRLVTNPHLRPPHSNEASAPDGFELDGDAVYGDLAKLRWEHSGWGVRLSSGEDVNGDDVSAGSVATTVSGISPEGGRWYRLTITGLAEENFKVEKEDLYLKVEFSKDDGRSPLDFIKKNVYAQVERERADLADPGTNKNLGASTWRSYALEFRTPFPEVDTLRLSAGFAHGAAKEAKRSEFWINRFELTPIPDPKSYVRRSGPKEVAARPESLVHLGGRWYYDRRGGKAEPPAQFDHTNADRLLYLSDRLTAPFSGNMTAWLRAGYLDLKGETVEEDKFLPDNVRIRVTDKHLVIRSKNLPNHPTAEFPDRWRALDGNPNYIAEKDMTWYLPLVPKENTADRVAMKDESNNDHALPMGPIGVAINGVVFFNPFDHLLDEDAVWRLDRCCGHPAPNSLYHYHKYPVCVKSPWTDDGTGHSPVIGFAFDGFPVYGPYEAKGELARESTANPLNDFNVHFDEVRGWHYHVTPGKFPHVIGGYWGVVDPSNRRSGPPGGAPGRGPGRGPPRGEPPEGGRAG